MSKDKYKYREYLNYKDDWITNPFTNRKIKKGGRIWRCLIKTGVIKDYDEETAKKENEKEKDKEKNKNKGKYELIDLSKVEDDDDEEESKEDNDENNKNKK